MHILSSHNRSEFLATPEIIRFENVRVEEGYEPTLLFKSSTLILKYIMLGIRMKLFFCKLGDRLLYGIKFFDDEEKPAAIWSIVERDIEKQAISALSSHNKFPIFLFNEIAINVAWVYLEWDCNSNINQLLDEIIIEPVDYSKYQNNVKCIFEQWETEDKLPLASIEMDIIPISNWNSISNHYIANSISSIPINLDSTDEGLQQENIAIWLTDNLNPIGAFHSPKIVNSKNYRELTDILLSYENGSILIESKAISIFNRDTLPNQSKLSKNVTNHIKKAINQLKGAIRQLKSGVIINSLKGEEINIERNQPLHSIVLIPELDLIQDRKMFGKTLIQDFINSTGGFIHILDLTELLRIVQAAEMISERYPKVTKMMAFDYYLIERAKKASEVGYLGIEMLIRFEE